MENTVTLKRIDLDVLNHLKIGHTHYTVHTCSFYQKRATKNMPNM